MPKNPTPTQRKPFADSDLERFDVYPADDAWEELAESNGPEPTEGDDERPHRQEPNKAAPPRKA